MIDGVAAEFMKRYPESPILTVHDELIVPARYRGEVIEMIKSEFGRHGVTPSVK